MVLSDVICKVCLCVVSVMIFWLYPVLTSRTVPFKFVLFIIKRISLRSYILLA